MWWQHLFSIGLLVVMSTINGKRETVTPSPFDPVDYCDWFLVSRPRREQLMLFAGGRTVKPPRPSTCWSVGEGLVSQEDFAQPVGV